MATLAPSFIPVPFHIGDLPRTWNASMGQPTNLRLRRLTSASFLSRSPRSGVAQYLAERLVAIDTRFARQPEYAFADDVPLDLVAPTGDGHDPPVQIVDRRRARLVVARLPGNA